MTTARRRKPAAGGSDSVERERDQEVVRATRELAAYFRGLRTEREARGALKIIKAFIRERERVAPSKRRPLPGGRSTPQVRTKERVVRKKARRKQPSSVEPAAAGTTEAD